MAKKSIPTAGQKQWGVVLNNHLSQAFDAVNGGLNTLSADPTRYLKALETALV